MSSVAPFDRVDRALTCRQVSPVGSAPGQCDGLTPFRGALARGTQPAPRPRAKPERQRVPRQQRPRPPAQSETPGLRPALHPEPGSAAAPRRPDGAGYGRSARPRSPVEPHRHVLDQEDEVVALVEDGQPVAGAAFGGAAEPLPPEGVGSAANGPAIVAHVVGSQPDRVASGMGEQQCTGTQPILGQSRVDVPRLPSRRQQSG